MSPLGRRPRGVHVFGLWRAEMLSRISPAVTDKERRVPPRFLPAVAAVWPQTSAISLVNREAAFSAFARVRTFWRGAPRGGIRAYAECRQRPSHAFRGMFGGDASPPCCRAPPAPQTPQDPSP